ncbi:TonB-dependent receptor plug domain-containing protein [Phenylobacterium sp.]|uniref:TonB-dependent receptor plug domain-containing protein n=1 Tax=Phenylobacterium sp. TaxID=1871053 RepID=UPI002F40E552
MTCARWKTLATSASAAALVLAASAHAQDAPQDAPPAAAPSDANVIVTATRVPATLATTPDVYVITDADIQARQATFAADVLSTAPGVVVTQSGAFGGLTGVSIRGAPTDKTLVLIDGVPVNDASSPSGGYDFGALDLGDISRVEILTGPQGALWGSDAIGGVVSFITKEPNGLAASLEGGSFDTWRAQASAGKSTQQWALGASISSFNTQGISAADVRDNYAPFGLPGFHNTEKDGDNAFTADIRGRYELTDWLGFDAQVRYDRAVTAIDGFPPPDFLFMDTNDVAVSESVEAFGRIRITGPWDLKNEISVSDYQIERGDHGESGDSGSIAYRQVYRYTVAKGTPEDLVSFVAGAERENSTASVSTGQKFDLDATSGFGVLQLHPFGPLTAIASVRYDAPDTFKAQTTARVGATYDLGWGFSVQGSFNQGFKTPTISETVCDFCFSPRVPLQPEHAQGYDGGLAWKSADGRVSLKVTAYHLDIRDEIEFAASGHYVNIARTRTQGVEAQANLVLGYGFRVQASYGYVDSIDATTGVRLLRVPLNTGSASLYWTHGRFDAAFTVRAEDNDLDLGLDSSDVIRPGFVVADLAGGYDVNDHVRLTARVENLANTHYQEVFGFGEPGAAFYLGVKLKD